MEIKVYPVPVGFDTCYIIQGEGIVMMDGGYPKKVKDFKKGIEHVSINPKEIQLMIITHGHWDHIGSASEIKEMTGAKIAMHNLEKSWLEEGLKKMPPGVTLWGRIFSKINTMLLPLIHIPATGVDIVLENQGLSLNEYGIAGRVLHTPGHSPGSVSVLLETGEAFVGDLAMNKFPLRLNPGFPIFAEDFVQLKESWRYLLDMGAKTIYPAHGKFFPADVISRALS